MVSKTKTGLLVAGIGLILSPFLSFIGTIIVIVGAALIFSGRNAWPAHKGTAAAGLGLIVASLVLALASFALIPSFFIAFSGTVPAGADPVTYANNLLTAFMLTVTAGVLGWIGILLLPWKITSGASKGLVVAGFVLGLIGYFAFLAFLLAIQGAIAGAAAGTVPDLTTLVAALLAALIGFVMLLIGYILAGVGYIIGRNRLPAGPMPGAAPM